MKPQFRNKKVVLNEFVQRKKKQIKMTSTAPTMEDFEEKTEVSTAALRRMIVDVRNAEEKYEAAKKIAREAMEVYEKIEEMLINTLKAAGVTKFAVPGLGQYSVTTKFSVRVPKDLGSKRELFEYIRKSYGPDVLDDFLSIHSQTLNAWFNNEAEVYGKDKKEFSVPGLEAPTERNSLRFDREKPK